MGFTTYLKETGYHLQQFNTGSEGNYRDKQLSMYDKYVSTDDADDEINSNGGRDPSEVFNDESADGAVEDELSDSFVQWVLSNREQISKILQKGEYEENEEELEDPQPEGDEDEPMDPQDEYGAGEYDELGPEEDDPDNFNRQGMIRTVPGAHLVYKRKTSDGLYDELWIFNVDNTAALDEYKIRNEILRGTDIAPHQTVSADGSQTYELWTAGNGQMMLITGLPN